MNFSKGYFLFTPLWLFSWFLLPAPYKYISFNLFPSFLNFLIPKWIPIIISGSQHSVLWDRWRVSLGCLSTVEHKRRTISSYMGLLGFLWFSGKVFLSVLLPSQAWFVRAHKGVLGCCSQVFKCTGAWSEVGSLPLILPPSAKDLRFSARPLSHKWRSREYLHYYWCSVGTHMLACQHSTFHK